MLLTDRYPYDNIGIYKFRRELAYTNSYKEAGSMKLWLTALGLLIPFLGTSLGAACVLPARRTLNPQVQRALPPE